MLFGTPFSSLGVPCRFPSRVALFDSYPIGTSLVIGMDSSFWVGSFGGLQDSVALLTNARLFSNNGNPIDGIRAVVRIPIINITFVSQ
ncbi:MAG: hypothetical protein P4L49_18560 [Desulfosporosinus sp.]|nr:hypothetical protein [Desulfosporosinus sp.]